MARKTLFSQWVETLARTLKTTIQTFRQHTVFFISEDSCRLSKRLNCFQFSGYFCAQVHTQDFDHHSYTVHVLTIWLHRITQCTQSRIANPPLLLQLRRAVTMVVWLHETITHMYSVTCALPFIWTPTYPAEAQKCMSSLLCVSAQ